MYVCTHAHEVSTGGFTVAHNTWGFDVACDRHSDQGNSARFSKIVQGACDYMPVTSLVQMSIMCNAKPEVLQIDSEHTHTHARTHAHTHFPPTKYAPHCYHCDQWCSSGVLCVPGVCVCVCVCTLHTTNSS